MKRSVEEINTITEKIIGAAFTVSNVLGAGFLEKVYENALRIEVRKSGLRGCSILNWTIKRSIVT